MASISKMALHPWEVLLDRPGSDRVGEEACSRDKRQTQASFTRRAEETEIMCGKEKSISSTKVKKRGRKASRGDGHKQGHTSRGDVRLAEGRSGTGRRSAQELEITFPAAYCTSSPSHAHYYIEVFPEIFKCKYCQEAKWQPTFIGVAAAFANEIRRVGLQKAYWRRVSRMPEVLDILYTLHNSKHYKR